MPYTANPPGTTLTREVAILSVDAVNNSATGMGRVENNAVGIANPLNQYFIDTSYYVGATQVTPTVGDQWYIQKIQGHWRLHSRISFNDPNQTIVPTQGQHIVGSGQGPVELSAGPNDTINASSPLAIASYTTLTLPSASSVPAGTHVYDTTRGLPVWSNGTYWHDAVGHVFYTADSGQSITANPTATMTWA